MRNAKKTLSLVMVAIFTTFIVLSGIPAGAVTTAQAKAQVTKATAAVVKVEKTVKVTTFNVTTAQTQLNAAAKEVAKVKNLGKTYTVTYKKLVARDAVVAKKIAAKKAANAKIAAALAKLNKDAEAAVAAAEKATDGDVVDLVGDAAALANAQGTVTAALELIVKLDNSTAAYKGLMARIDAANNLIVKAMDEIAAAEEAARLAAEAEAAAKAAVDAAEKAVAAVEAAPLATATDLAAAVELGKTAVTAVAAVTDTEKAAAFTARLKVMADKGLALQAKLAADAEALKPAKIVTVSAVDGTITVNFDKKPLTTVAAVDFTVNQTVTTASAVTTKVTPTVTVVSDTAVTLTVPAVVASTTDQSVVYSVAYTTGAAVTAAAYTVAKIPVLSVKSVTTLNLKQVQVVFNKKVDDTSAENIANYYQDLVPLTAATAIAELQADEMTVLITYAGTKAQQTALAFAVKNVKSADLTETVATNSTDVSFMDITAPAVTSVEVTGNTQITITYSEPTNDDQVAKNIASYTMDGYSLSAFGLTSIDWSDSANAISKHTKVVLTFGVKIPSGVHAFKVLGSTVRDGASFYVPATENSITVIADTSYPKFVSATCDGLYTVDITFSKPVVIPTNAALAVLKDSITINGLALAAGTTITYPDSTNKAVVELGLTATNKLATGVNVINILKSAITDFYGNTSDDGAMRFSVTAAADATLPTVVKVSATDDTTILVAYSEAMGLNVTNTANYTIYDGSGNDVTDITNVTVVANQDYTWNINLASALPGGVYTITIANVIDTSSNVIASVTKSISVTDTTSPSRPTAALISDSGSKVKVSFNEAMDYTSITTLANYMISLNGANGTYGALDTINSGIFAGVTVTAATDNKSVVLDFPGGAGTINVNNYFLKTLLLKDVAGNYTAAIADTAIAIAPITSLTPAFLRSRAISTTQLEVEYDKALNVVTPGDFRFVNGNVSTPATYAVLQNTSVYNAASTALIDGAKITLTFPAGTIPTDVKTLGGLTVVETNTVDSVGNHVASGAMSVAGNATTYVRDKVKPTLAATPFAIVDATHVTITFTEPLQPGLATLYMNDFTVTNGGSTVTNYKSTVNGNVITITLNSSLDFAQDTVLTPRATVAYVQDVNANLYVPTTTDLDGYTVTAATATAQVALANATAAVVTAETTPTQVNHDAAATLVTALAASAAKTDLVNRLAAVQTTIDTATAAALVITNATNAVVLAETAPLTQAKIDAATTLVNLVPAGAVHTGLDNRLAVVQASVTAAAGADAVTAQIAALPALASITLANEAAVVAARTAYDLLTVAQKALVTNLATLTSAEVAITVLNQAAANQVMALIAALPTATTYVLADDADIVAARAAYTGLSVTQKPLVTNLALLTGAEAAVTARLAAKAALDTPVTGAIAVATALELTATVDDANAGNALTVTTAQDTTYETAIATATAAAANAALTIAELQDALTALNAATVAFNNALQY